MFDDQILRRHRLSALANGALIGLGIATVVFYFGIALIIIGVAIELWQRSRISRQS